MRLSAAVAAFVAFAMLATAASILHSGALKPALALLTDQTATRE